MIEPQENPGTYSPQGRGNIGDEESAREARLTDGQGLEVFTTEEAARLVVAKSRYLRGELNESTAEHKRLLFARWLYQHGHLAD